jgi:nucleoid-associated protein YgaU
VVDGSGDTGGGSGSGDTDKSRDNKLFGSKPTDPWAPGVGKTDDTAGGAGAGTDIATDAGTSGTGALGTGTLGAGTGGLEVGVTTPVDVTPPVTDPDPGGVEITMLPSGPVDPDPAGTSFTPAVVDSSPGPIGLSSPIDVPYPVTADTSTGGAGASVVGASRTHVIKSNDSLWKVAEAYYGHGKHWQFLAKANPGSSPNALVVGRTIKIPPLPTQIGSSVGGAVTAVGVTGTITQSADGTKIYIVAKDDSFWKIAARSDVYGNGIHYKQIAAANPGANSNSLQPGDKLVIPPLETSSSGGVFSSGPVAAPDPVTATGEKIYVVQSGDSGMWGVSNSQYGNGKYWPAIAGRNPGVNPSRLRIGQKLVLPSLEQAKAYLSGSTGGTGASSGAGGTSAGGTSAPTPVRTPRPVPAPAPTGGSDEPDFS